MIDGTVARKTGTANDFGSKFDSIADFIFVAVCLIRLIPLLPIEKWLLIWIVLITVIKVVNILFTIIKIKRIVFLHTILNKITGLLTFILPLTFSFLDFRYTSIVVCIIATIAAIQEGYFLRTKKILMHYHFTKNLDWLKIESDFPWMSEKKLDNSEIS